MLLMSPGLALFLFGVSSIPGEGTMAAPKVWVSMLVGAALMGAFVWHSFRPEHPLLDLRLFANRNLTVSVITMFLFAAAFFGGLLLVPTYFQQIRGASTLEAGLLVAPQGLGAMVTMPIAGRLVDKVPVGRIVPVGLLLIVVSMFGLTRITEDTPYSLLIPILVVMGFGMGATMMPLFTSALRTLKSHEVARGSTLLNITQQVASSVGVALMSVILTNQLNESPVVPGTDGLTETDSAILYNTQPDVLRSAGHCVSSTSSEVLLRQPAAFAETVLGVLDPGRPHADSCTHAAPQARRVPLSRRPGPAAGGCALSRRGQSRSLISCRRARRAVCLDGQVADVPTDLLCDRDGDLVRTVVVEAHAAAGAVAVETMPDVEVLLEVVAEWEVQERPAAGGQLHGRGQPTLDDGQVAHRQMAVELVDVRADLEAVVRR